MNVISPFPIDRCRQSAQRRVPDDVADARSDRAGREGEDNAGRRYAKVICEDDVHRQGERHRPHEVARGGPQGILHAPPPQRVDAPSDARDRHQRAANRGRCRDARREQNELAANATIASAVRSAVLKVSAAWVVVFICAPAGHVEGSPRFRRHHSGAADHVHRQRLLDCVREDRQSERRRPPRMEELRPAAPLHAVVIWPQMRASSESRGNALLQFSQVDLSSSMRPSFQWWLIVRSVVRRMVSSHAGLMFWFIRNRFVGSYFFLSFTSRSYVAP